MILNIPMHVLGDYDRMNCDMNRVPGFVGDLWELADKKEVGLCRPCGCPLSCEAECGAMNLQSNNYGNEHVSHTGAADSRCMCLVSFTFTVANNSATKNNCFSKMTHRVNHVPYFQHINICLHAYMLACLLAVD